MTKSTVSEPDSRQGSALSTLGLVAPTAALPIDGMLHPVASSAGVTEDAEPTQEQAARALGARWALEVRRTLRLEKRRAAGGWPGTKREAQARATWLLATRQSEHLERSFHAATVTDVAKAVYASARSTWLANAEEEDDDCIVEQ